jgi:hypothetical protein
MGFYTEKKADGMGRDCPVSRYNRKMGEEVLLG